MLSNVLSNVLGKCWPSACLLWERGSSSVSSQHESRGQGRGAAEGATAEEQRSGERGEGKWGSGRQGAWFIDEQLVSHAAACAAGWEMGQPTQCRGRACGRVRSEGAARVGRAACVKLEPVASVAYCRRGRDR